MEETGNTHGRMEASSEGGQAMESEEMGELKVKNFDGMKIG